METPVTAPRPDDAMPSVWVRLRLEEHYLLPVDEAVLRLRTGDWSGVTDGKVTSARVDNDHGVNLGKWDRSA